MLLLDRKKHGIHFCTVWLADKPVRQKGVIAYREAKYKPQHKKNVAEFDTLLTDLTETEDEIKQHFAKNCKYEVNRAYRENIQAQIKCGTEVKDEDIKDFCDFFVKFWDSKGIMYSDAEKLLKELTAYRNMGALAIGQAIVQGEKSVYHTYIVGLDWVRLLHSASLYRLSADNEGKLKNLIGMANRNLHYEDMLFFKNLGKITYDWGGAGTNEEVAAITKFKQSFGGTPAKYYEFEEVNGVLANFFKLVVKILKK